MESMKLADYDYPLILTNLTALIFSEGRPYSKISLQYLNQELFHASIFPLVLELKLLTHIV
jgi:hypothetical protein